MTIMSILKTPDLLEEYILRFNNFKDNASFLLLPTIAKLDKAEFLPVNGSMMGFVTYTLPARSDYKSFSVASKYVHESIDYLISWLDLSKEEVSYSRKVEKGVEFVSLSFSK